MDPQHCRKLHFNLNSDPDYCEFDCAAPNVGVFAYGLYKEETDVDVYPAHISCV